MTTITNISAANSIAASTGAANADRLELEFRQAAYENKTKTMLALSDRGVNIDSKGIVSGQTAAHRAAAKGNAEALRLLFNLGANFDLQDSDGKTPQEHAQSPETTMIFALIRSGKGAIAARKIFYPTAFE